MFTGILSFCKKLSSRPQKISDGLTSTDLLKSLALILMFVDHIGHFFYPDEEWFRVVGRLSVPIWFFLIGYADVRKVQGVIWLGGFVVLLSTLISGYYIFPLNVLFTLALARLWVDRLMFGALQNYEAFVGMFFILLFLGVPSAMFFEYGAFGMMFTVFGYMRRHHEGLEIRPLAKYGFLVAIGVVYVAFSGLSLTAFSNAQLLFLSVALFFLMMVMYHFRRCEFVSVPQGLERFMIPFKILGRHTLLIYVLHLSLLNILMIFIGDERYGFGQVQILVPPFQEAIRAIL
ncbi:MAG: TraX family protein [Bdellovibrionales bacterium]